MANINEDYFKTNNNINTSIESFLMQSEKILWKGRPKKSAYVAGKSIAMTPIALVWGLIDFSILFFIFGSGVPVMMLFFIIPFFALHLTPVWVWVHSLVKSSREQKTIEYVITNLRIIEFRGESRYIYESVYLDKLDDATLHIGFIDKILNVGDITIKSGDKQLILSDISDSVNMHTKILALIKDPLAKEQEFFSEKTECLHCGTYYSSGDLRCPSCGAPQGKK